MNPSDVELLISKWRDSAQKCADEIGKALESTTTPMRWEIERLTSTRDALNNCATELRLLFNMRSTDSVHSLLSGWKRDSEWHRKRAKDYAARCGGAPQWIAEAAADMLMECVKELEDAIKNDSATRLRLHEKAERIGKK